MQQHRRRARRSGDAEYGDQGRPRGGEHRLVQRRQGRGSPSLGAARGVERSLVEQWDGHPPDVTVTPPIRGDGREFAWATEVDDRTDLELMRQSVHVGGGKAVQAVAAVESGVPRPPGRSWQPSQIAYVVGAIEVDPAWPVGRLLLRLCRHARALAVAATRLPHSMDRGDLAPTRPTPSTNSCAPSHAWSSTTRRPPQTTNGWMQWTQALDGTCPRRSAQSAACGARAATPGATEPSLALSTRGKARSRRCGPFLVRHAPRTPVQSVRTPRRFRSRPPPG